VSIRLRLVDALVRTTQQAGRLLRPWLRGAWEGLHAQTGWPQWALLANSC